MLYALLCVTLFFSSCSHNDTEKSSSNEGVSIDVTKLIPIHSQSVIQLPGELYAYEYIDVYAKVLSFIEHMYVDRGSIVKKGEIITTLTAPELVHNFEEAMAK